MLLFQAIYEKGTDDEIAEFIYQTLDVNGNGVLTRYRSRLSNIFSCGYSTGSLDNSSDRNWTEILRLDGYCAVSDILGMSSGRI